MDSLPAGLENFESVWARVVASSDEKKETAAAEPAAGEHMYGDRSVLEELIGLSHRNARIYRSLALRCHSRLSGELKSLERGAEGRLKKLQTEYFLLTGDSLTPPDFNTPDGGVPSALRDAYVNEREIARSCLAFAGKTRSEDLKALCSVIGDAAAAHEKKLRRIIENIL